MPPWARCWEMRSSNRADLQRLQQVGEDRAALAELAHRIKGGARIAGGEGLAALCEQLERCCADQSQGPVQLRLAIQTLAQAMRRLDHSLDLQAAQGVDQAGTP